MVSQKIYLKNIKPTYTIAIEFRLLHKKISIYNINLSTISKILVINVTISRMWKNLLLQF